MAKEAVPVMCYWDGFIKEGPMGVYFEGSGPDFMWLHPDLSFSEMVNKLYVTMGWDKSRFSMKIFGRYLARIDPDYFLKFPIVDDNSLSGMFHMFGKTQPKLTCIEIYLEKKIIGNDNTAGTSQIRLMEPSQYREESTNPRISDVVPTPSFLYTSSLNEADVSRWVPLGGENPTCQDEIYVGRRFSTKASLQEAVTEYSIKRHSQFKVVESKKSVWALKCKNAPSCKWSLRASIGSESDNFEIVKLIEPHTCINPIIDTRHANLKAKVVMAHIFEVVRKDSSIKIKTIQDIILKAFNVEISYHKAWSAKQKAIAQCRQGGEQVEEHIDFTAMTSHVTQDVLPQSEDPTVQFMQVVEPSLEATGTSNPVEEETLNKRKKKRSTQ